MAKLPETILSPTAQSIYKLHEKRNATEAPRQYLGWSEVGTPCNRALWYNLRWASNNSFDGRMLRLFQTGFREEDRVLQELRDCGFEVYDRAPDGTQFGCENLGGHLRGHIDAVVKGLPEAPKTPHLVDIKTCNEKRFNELLKKGMQAVYPKYWAQAQGYMGEMGLTRAMYIFVCKNDDRIHTERIEFDQSEFDRLVKKAHEAIFSPAPPERINLDATSFDCRFCDHHAVCHGTQAPRVSCRTCAHSTPLLDSGGATWACEYQCDIMSICEQRAGCKDHIYLPTILNFATPSDANEAENWVHYLVKNTDLQIRNGIGPQCATSLEIFAEFSPKDAK